MNSVQRDRCENLSRETGLLVSARTCDEARIVLQHPVEWLDLKEPSLGSLGRPRLALVHQVDALVREFARNSTSTEPQTKWSVAGGELSEWNDDLISLYAAALPESVALKIAVRGDDFNRAVESHTDGLKRLERISGALFKSERLILVHFADDDSDPKASWERWIDAAVQLDTRYVLVDTLNKSRGHLMTHYSLSELSQMIEFAATHGIRIALAGSLRIEHLSELAAIGAGWLGVRGAACSDDDRVASICSQRLTRIVQTMQSANKRLIAS